MHRASRSTAHLLRFRVDDGRPTAPPRGGTETAERTRGVAWGWFSGTRGGQWLSGVYLLGTRPPQRTRCTGPAPQRTEIAAIVILR